MIKNITFIAALVISSVCNAEDVQSSTIGYPSYEAALSDLKANPNARISQQDGWIVIEMNSNSEMALWSFTTEGHFAHPAVIKRNIVESDQTVDIVMNALCGGTKPNCDKLIGQFEELNERISQNMQKDS